MKAGVKYLCIFPIFMWIFCFVQPTNAEAPGVEYIGNFGAIDWIEQRILATGIGAPPAKYLGQPKARPNAQRAAVTVARRNLLEVLKGVHIDSKTRVENSLIQDDKIIATVTGLLNASNIDGYRYLEDGTIEATVSIPLTGELGEVLIRTLSRTTKVPHREFSATAFSKHDTRLEERVRALENELQDINNRLSSLEKSIPEAGIKIAPEKSKTIVPYTGLVIDARDTGFRPCLKPEIYGMSELMYPGDYVDQTHAVRTGFIRYYRNLTRAQQSPRVGSLPYTISAKGTFNGERNLEIDDEAYQVLKAYVDASAKFLVECHVVIVF